MNSLGWGLALALGLLFGVLISVKAGIIASAVTLLILISLAVFA